MLRYAVWALSTISLTVSADERRHHGARQKVTGVVANGHLRDRLLEEVRFVCRRDFWVGKPPGYRWFFRLAPAKPVARYSCPHPASQPRPQRWPGTPQASHFLGKAAHARIGSRKIPSPCDVVCILAHAWTGRLWILPVGAGAIVVAVAAPAAGGQSPPASPSPWDPSPPPRSLSTKW